MTKAGKKKLRKYGLTLGLAGLFSLCYALGQDIGSQSLVDKYRILCDAFTVPGLLMVLFALLMTVSSEGALDGIGYALRRVGKALTFRGAEQERYGDYVARRQEKRPKGFGFLYVVGLTFLAIAGIFLLLFYSVF